MQAERTRAAGLTLHSGRGGGTPGGLEMVAVDGLGGGRLWGAGMLQRGDEHEGAMGVATERGLWATVRDRSRVTGG